MQASGFTTNGRLYVDSPGITIGGFRRRRNIWFQSYTEVKLEVPGHPHVWLREGDTLTLTGRIDVTTK